MYGGILIKYIALYRPSKSGKMLLIGSSLIKRRVLITHHTMRNETGPIPLAATSLNNLLHHNTTF